MYVFDRPITDSAGVIAVLFLSAWGLSCSSSLPDRWNRSLETSGPVRSGDTLVYLNHTLERVHRLEPTRSGNALNIKRSRAPGGDDPTTMAIAPDGEQLFVLNAGARTLGVYDLTDSELSREVVQLESRYDQIEVSPNGDFVLLTFSEDPDEDCVVCNVNEVGIVDLRKGVPNSAKFVSLTKRATELVFAEPFEVAGAEQRLVAALSPSLITFIDLREALALQEVPLTVTEAQSVRLPAQATFDIHPDDETPAAAHLYVRTAQGRDVTQIALKPSNSPRTFDVSLNQLAAGEGPSAMTMLEFDDGTKRLMTLDRGRPAFSLIDVQSGESSTFDLPVEAPANGMLTYRLGEGDEAETRVLAYSTNSEVVAVVRPETIAVSGTNPTLGRSVEAVRLEGRPTSIRLQSSGARTRAVAALQGGNTAVLKLRADDNVATPIQSPPLSDLVFGGEAAWGVFADTGKLARYDLETGHGTPYDLPVSGSRVFYDAEESLLMVQHDRTTGTFSLLKTDELAADSEREHARVFEELFLETLLQRTPTASR